MDPQKPTPQGNTVELSVRLDIGDRQPADALKYYVEHEHALVGKFLRDLPESTISISPSGGKVRVQVERIQLFLAGEAAT